MESVAVNVAAVADTAVLRAGSAVKLATEMLFALAYGDSDLAQSTLSRIVLTMRAAFAAAVADVAASAVAAPAIGVAAEPAIQRQAGKTSLGAFQHVARRDTPQAAAQVAVVQAMQALQAIQADSATVVESLSHDLREW